MKNQNLLFALSVVLSASMLLADENTYDLERMVITPTRASQKQTIDIPQSIDTLSDSTINSTVRVDLQDYVQEIPGVGMASSGSSGRTSSNSANRNSDYFNSGFTIRGLGGARVLVLTDGVRQSGQGIGYGGGNLALYDLFAIQKVEVLKGPGSVLYGTDAFGGVINIISHSPTIREDFGVSNRLRVAADASRNSLSFGGMTDFGDQKWGVVAGASHTVVEEPSLPDGLTPTGGDYIKDSGFVKAQYRPSADSALTFTANIVDIHDIDIYHDNSNPRFNMAIPFYQRKMASVEYELNDISENLRQWKVGLFTQELNRRFHRSSPYFPPFDFTVYEVTETDDTVHTHELHNLTAWEFGRHNVTVGLDVGYDTNYLSENQGLTSGSMAHKTKAEAQQLRLGLYAQDQFDIDRHSFTIGVRGDYFDLSDELNKTDNSESGLSGSLGYLYHLDAQNSLYTTLATGFRSPDLDERYQDTVVNYFTENVTVQGNPDLKPERSYSFELGLKREAEDGLWELAGYYNAISDYIGETLVSSTPAGPRTFIVKQRNNIGDVGIYGFEAGWRSPKASAWRNYAHVYRTWTDATDKVAMPDWSFGYGIGYRFDDVAGFSSITPSWRGRYVTSSYDSLANVYFSAFHVADLQVAFKCERTKVDTQLIVGIKNIFDKKYYEPFMSNAQPGRGLFAALQADF